MKTHKHKKPNSKPSKTRKHGGVMINISKGYYKSLSPNVKRHVQKTGVKFLSRKYKINDKYTRKLRGIDSGAFGYVFKGSINDGEYKNDGVTKVYFKRYEGEGPPRAYTKEINPPEILRTLISQKIYSEPYEKPIIKRNFLKRIDNSSIFKKLNKTKNDDPLYMVKMQNLGESILPPSGYYSKLNHIKMNKLAIQILKLLLVIYEINIKGYIHGDVRPENVMIDRYGNITLIDFDHFNTLLEFNPELLRAFHMPLECQILTYARYIKNNDNFANEYMEHVNNTKKILYDTITKNYSEDVYHEWMQQRSDKGDNVINHAKKFYNAIINAKYNYNDSDFNIGYNLIKNNIDLYGVGICICGILLGIDDPRREDYIRGVQIDKYVLKYIEKELLPNIMDGLQERERTKNFNRWTIREAIDNYSKCLLENIQNKEDIKDIKDLLQILTKIDKSTSEQPRHQIEQRQQTSEEAPGPSQWPEEEAPGPSQWPEESPPQRQQKRNKISNADKRDILERKRLRLLMGDMIQQGYSKSDPRIIDMNNKIKFLEIKLKPLLDLLSN